MATNNSGPLKPHNTWWHLAKEYAILMKGGVKMVVRVDKAKEWITKYQWKRVN